MALPALRRVQPERLPFAGEMPIIFDFSVAAWLV